MTMTQTRTLTRSELSTIAYDYARAGGRDTSIETALDLLDGARSSMIGREDVAEIEIEDGDAEIVQTALTQAVAQMIEDEAATA